MAAEGYVFGSAIDEESPVSSYWSGDGFDAELNEALFFPAASNTVQEMRVEEGTFQQRFDDIDVRLTRAYQTISTTPPATSPS